MLVPPSCSPVVHRKVWLFEEPLDCLHATPRCIARGIPDPAGRIRQTICVLGHQMRQAEAARHHRQRCQAPHEHALLSFCCVFVLSFHFGFVCRLSLCFELFCGFPDRLGGGRRGGGLDHLHRLNHLHHAHLGQGRRVPRVHTHFRAHRPAQQRVLHLHEIGGVDEGRRPPAVLHHRVRGWAVTRAPALDLLDRVVDPTSCQLLELDFDEAALHRRGPRKAERRLALLVHSGLVLHARGVAARRKLLPGHSVRARQHHEL
mmetsp:Transcript_3883/g.9451  ORF Transcript_3883/g.9451 Transcript_3883/m.9451 type:complete len:260 (+) Transcript_3883:443-1222(+)